jgi:uncharacterized OB-fold protein
MDTQAPIKPITHPPRGLKAVAARCAVCGSTEVPASSPEICWLCKRLWSTVQMETTEFAGPPEGWMEE